MTFAKLYLNEDVDRFSLQYLSEHFGIENKKVIVQGLGNVGYYSAKFFREHVPLDDMLFEKAIAELTRQDQLKNINCRDFVPKFTALF